MPIGAFKLNTLSALIQSSITATGGTVGYSAQNGITYKFHTFDTVGSNNFIISSTTGTATIDALIVGGGGGAGASGGGSFAAGGGGGGQVQEIKNITVSPQTYTLTVGGGGAKGTSSSSTTGTAGSKGGDTTFLGYTSSGGGGSAGLSVLGVDGQLAGGPGQSSVASQGRQTNTGTYSGGTSVYSAGGNNVLAGGGGSNSAVGGNGTVSPFVGGAGAAGPVYSYNGTIQPYGSGGGGGSVNGSNGANGGGTYGTGATGATAGSNTAGVNGNSGVVIVRYPLSTPFSFNYITNSTSTTSTIGIPATAQVGDIAILFDYAQASGTTSPTAVTPTGWTSLQSRVSQTTNPACAGATWYKTLVSGDPGSTVTCMSSSVMNKMIVIYRPSLTPNTITASNGNIQATASAPSSQTLSLPTTSQFFVGWAWYQSSGTITTRGSTVTASRELNIGTTMYVKLFEASNGATTFSNPTISMSDYGSNVLCTGNILVI
jgi:hypothetical protein